MFEPTQQINDKTAPRARVACQLTAMLSLATLSFACGAGQTGGNTAADGYAGTVGQGGNDESSMGGSGGDGNPVEGGSAGTGTGGNAGDGAAGSGGSAGSPAQGGMAAGGMAGSNTASCESGANQNYGRKTIFWNGTGGGTWQVPTGGVVAADLQCMNLAQVGKDCEYQVYLDSQVNHSGSRSYVYRLLRYSGWAESGVSFNRQSIVGAKYLTFFIRIDAPPRTTFRDADIAIRGSGLYSRYVKYPNAPEEGRPREAKLKTYNPCILPDGQWREVVIPVQDMIRGHPDFDVAGSLFFGSSNPGADLTIYIDDIGFYF